MLFKSTFLFNFKEILNNFNIFKKGILIHSVFLLFFSNCNKTHLNINKISNYIVDSFYIFNVYDPDNLRFLNDSTIVEIKTNGCFELSFYVKKKILGKNVYIPIISRNIELYGKYFELHNINDTNYLFLESNNRYISVYKIHDNKCTLNRIYEISRDIVPENYILYLNHSVILNDTLLVFRIIYDDYEEIYNFLNSNNMLYSLNLNSKKVNKIEMGFDFNSLIKYHFEYRLLENINESLIYIYFDTIMFYKINKNNLVLCNKKYIKNKYLKIRYKIDDFKNNVSDLDLLNYNSYYKNFIKIKNKYLIVFYSGGHKIFNNEFYHYHEYISHLILLDAEFRIKKYIVNDLNTSVFLEEFLLTKSNKVCFSHKFNYKKSLNKFYIYDFN